MRLLFTPGAARTINHALRDGRVVTGTLRAVARDAAGNSAVKRLPVRVVPNQG